MKILLLSGGYDSTALAWLERPGLALTVDYGQLPARGEIRASRAICTALEIQHEVLTLRSRELGSGDLAGRPALTSAPSSEWWPFRNQLLLTVASMRALQRNARSIIIGTVNTDSFHADGRSEFIHHFNRLLAVQEGGLTAEAPCIERSTVELIRFSQIPREILAWCHSCHVAEWACGSCRGCLKALAVRIALGYEQA
jgi:7-cyano-7-deazaguanine synthase